MVGTCRGRELGDTPGEQMPYRAVTAMLPVATLQTGPLKSARRRQARQAAFSSRLSPRWRWACVRRAWDLGAWRTPQRADAISSRKMFPQFKSSPVLRWTFAQEPTDTQPYRFWIRWLTRGGRVASGAVQWPSREYVPVSHVLVTAAPGPSRRHSLLNWERGFHPQGSWKRWYQV